MQVTLPFRKQPVAVMACGRLKRLGRPSGQKSPCGSSGGIGWLIRNGSAKSSYRLPARNPGSSSSCFRGSTACVEDLPRRRRPRRDDLQRGGLVRLARLPRAHGGRVLAARTMTGFTPDSHLRPRRPIGLRLRVEVLDEVGGVTVETVDVPRSAGSRAASVPSGGRGAISLKSIH